MVDKIERRKNYRFQAYDNTVAVWRNSQTGGVGPLLDVSRGGVGVGTYYIPGITQAGAYEVDIFNASVGFQLLNLKMVFVSEISLDNDFLSVMKPVWKYGFRFLEMTPEQKAKLDNLILNNTKREDFIKSE